ncbi:MAG: GNAT family N-acetyltransferase, partial [Clostridia bacterium]|nr:GNAT family N-acetyltransferase [Clostridia bacterium]
RARPELSEDEIMECLFETERLRIRRFCPEDALTLYENHAEAAVKKWIPNESYADADEAREAIGFYMDCVNQDRLPFVLAVESKRTGGLIGDAGINEVDGQPNEVEIGFTICEAFSGKGLATELVQAMTAYAMSRFGIHTLYGRVLHGNAASVRVLEKNGYAFVREEFDAEDDPYGKGMLIYRSSMLE